MSTNDKSHLNMMAERPPLGPRNREHTSTAAATVQQPPADATPYSMGSVEAEIYKKDWRASYRYRAHDKQTSPILSSTSSITAPKISLQQAPSWVRMLAPQSARNSHRGPAHIMITKKCCRSSWPGESARK